MFQLEQDTAYCRVETSQDGGLLRVCREVCYEQFGLRLKLDNRSTPKVICRSEDRDFSLRKYFTLFQRVEREDLLVRLEYCLSFVRNN